MGTANTLLEILQLGDQIPIAHALEAGGIRCLHAPPVRTVAGCAGCVKVLTSGRTHPHRWRGRIIRQRLDISDDIFYGGVIRKSVFTSVARSRAHWIFFDTLAFHPPGPFRLETHKDLS